jgi:hypothetical protein
MLLKFFEFESGLINSYINGLSLAVVTKGTNIQYSSP